MASNDKKDSNSGDHNKKNQGGGCSSGAKKKKNGDPKRKRKVRPELQNTSRSSSSSDGVISSELTQLPILRRTGSGDNHDKEKLLLVLMDKDKNLYSVPRELKLLVETAVRKQQQQENSKLTALRIASFRHYTTAEEEEEERRRGVSTRLELYSDPWKIKKRLTPSDLGSQSRMLIQTKQVETHLKPYMLRAGLFDQVLSAEGLRVPVWDVDTDTVHEVVFKQWQTNRSYVFIGSWNQEFLDRRRLKENDMVGFLWDPYGSRFCFKVLSRARPPNPNPTP